MSKITETEPGPETQDEQYRCELWWKTPHSKIYSRVDFHIEKDINGAREWLKKELDDLRAEDKEDVFEKRVVIDKTIDCIGFRKFKVILAEKIIESKMEF